MIRFRFLILCLLMAATAFPVFAAGVVATLDSDRATIRFETDEKTDYQAKLAGGSVIVRFEKPQMINPRDIKTGLKSLVSEVILSGDKKTLIIGLNEPATLAHSSDSTGILLTLIPGAESLPGVEGDEKPFALPPPPPESKPMAAIVPPVKIRTGKHPEYYRVVFEFASATPHQLEQQDGRVSVSFETAQPIPASELKKAQVPDCDLSSPVALDGKIKIDMQCSRLEPVVHFGKNNLVVLDFKQSAKTEKPAVTPVAAQPKPEIPKPPVDPKEESKFALPSVDLKPAVETTPPPAPEPQPVLNDTPDDPLEPVAVDLTAVKTSTVLSFKMQWQKPAAAAIFKRAGYAWMVFDRPSDVTMNKETQSVLNVIGGMDVIKSPGSTAFRIHTVPGFEPTVQASEDKKTWQIDYKSQKIRPAVSIPTEYKEFADRQFGLYLTVPHSGRVVVLNDPEVGDQIIAATVHIPGRGVNGEREFSEFSLLPSAQGIAVVPKAPDIEMRPDFDGFMVVKNSGVLLLAQNKLPEPQVSSTGEGASPDMYGPWISEGTPSNPPILLYAQWRGDPKIGFFKKEQALLNEIGLLKPGERMDKRMELAKLYYSNGWMAEAIAVMNVCAAWDDTILKSPEFLAIRGSAYILEQNYKQATEDLRDQRFDEQPDVATWRAVLAVQQNDWAASDQYFTMSDQPNDAPPPNAKKLIGLSQIESEISNNHLDQAKNIIDRLSKDPQLSKMADILNYWRGEIAMREENPAEAVKLWEKVIKNEEPYSRPRAEFALIKYGESNGSLTREDVIARLERLRFAWRGDKFEFNVLHMLGKMQIQDNLYREGLFTLRRAVTNYADQPYVVELTDLMTDTFKKLFMDGAADTMPPLTALGLFDEFRDLTPTGPDGDKIIQRLVDRLIAVDLLERSADLLQHQVNYRLQGEDKARVGAKLAFVYLLDRKPEDAIKALDQSNAPVISPEITAERRLLRARAVFDTGKAQEALDLIAGEKSREAELLRADIYWRMRNWNMVSGILSQLIVETRDQELKNPADMTDEEKKNPKLPPQTAQWILNLAISVALNGDNAALKNVKNTYWAAMKSSPQFDAFEIITNVDATEPMSLGELSGKLEEAAKYENFMNFYRDKIKKGTFAIN